MAPFVDRYLPFAGNENYRKRTPEWALDNSPYEGSRANTQALKYYETGDVPHLKECLDTVFFMSLRYSTEAPRISDNPYMYGWLKTNFRVIQWPLYLRALADAQAWYFRTAPDQKRLELRAVEDNLVEAGIHIRTRDGSRIVAHLGGDGRFVGCGGTLKATVEPNTLYYMAISGEPTLTAVGHPLILAPSGEDWFDPADESRTSGD